MKIWDRLWQAARAPPRLTPAPDDVPCGFFFDAAATTEIYTLSLHDALPISRACRDGDVVDTRAGACGGGCTPLAPLCGDRKSTRLNSSHSQISYAVFCLKKKNSGTCGPGSTRRSPPPRRRA